MDIIRTLSELSRVSLLTGNEKRKKKKGSKSKNESLVHSRPKNRTDNQNKEGKADEGRANSSLEVGRTFLLEYCLDSNENSQEYILRK